eukprot:TRINITY_DN1564_c0_g1_i1.p1 TRINITY_DN1564_c0_g1~~TRINITY_DN1564_c0_g1_i1.p1  ORF type:complete len:227 (+),score=52.49 TRINITY_DN1564_c0_g1_i1:336-1016(+)
MVRDYKAPRTCKDHVLRDLPLVMKQVTQWDYLVGECEALASYRLLHIPPGSPQLSKDQALAIALYTFDLSISSTQGDGSDNFYHNLNTLLRRRSGPVMEAIKPYLWYLLSALAALPKWQGVAYRGVPPDTLPLIKQKYRQGITVHWSSFTSTTVSLDKAKEFARPGGVVFTIQVTNGRNVENYSAAREGEVLLDPNSRFVVAENLAPLDGFYHLHLVQLVIAMEIY